MRQLLWAVGIVCLASGCGWSVGSAREAAAQHTCTWYNKCSNIGSGKTYASFDECLTNQRSNWLNTWPSSSCDATINNPATDSCIAAIDNTACDSILDIANTAVKCSAYTVCK
jgi:hypothetical protein